MGTFYKAKMSILAAVLLCVGWDAMGQNPYGWYITPGSLKTRADSICKGDPNAFYVTHAPFYAKGDGNADDTEAIQKAIDATKQGKRTVCIPDGIYLINVDPDTSSKLTGLKLKSHLRLVLYPKAILKVRPNNEKTYKVLELNDVTDVEIFGGAIEGDVPRHFIHPPPVDENRNGEIDIREYRNAAGEWGMGISIKGSSSIHVTHVTITDCWGDGIYIAGSSKKAYSEYVVITGVISGFNRRQGLSLISGRYVWILSSVFSHTGMRMSSVYKTKMSTSPAAGIDIEPNTYKDVIENIELRHVMSYKNDGSGLIIAFSNGWGKSHYSPIINTFDLVDGPVNSQLVDDANITFVGGRSNVDINATLPPRTPNGVYVIIENFTDIDSGTDKSVEIDHRAGFRIDDANAGTPVFARGNILLNKATVIGSKKHHFIERNCKLRLLGSSLTGFEQNALEVCL